MARSINRRIEALARRFEQMKISHYDLFHDSRFEKLEYFNCNEMVIASKEALEWIKAHSKR